MKPSDEQINKRIAEFMGLELPWTQFGFEKYSIVTGRTSCFSYTTSLDALVPVVEKLDMSYVLFWEKSLWWAGWLPDNEADLEYIEQQYSDKSPSRALAMAIFEVLDER